MPIRTKSILGGERFSSQEGQASCKRDEPDCPDERVAGKTIKGRFEPGPGGKGKPEQGECKSQIQ